MDSIKVLIKLLEIYGGSGEIYNAIDSYDMAKVVRAATNALKNLKYIREDHIGKDPKSSADSERSRNIGNDHYKAGRHRQALIQYNVALALAPNGSKEMMLAYGNRSAVMFTIRYFTGCQEDVRKCLSMNCPKGLAKKLSKRSEDTYPYIHEELMLELSTSNLFVQSFFQFDCKKNADVPCATADIAFVSRDGAKLITAGKVIKPGRFVAIERAFVTSATIENQYITCYHCNRMALGPHPCKGCCRAMFCDSECRDLCMEEYHRIECQVVDLLQTTYEEPVNKLMTRSAIKLSLRLGWDALITASKDIGASRMRTATVRKTYNSEEPLSILSYDDDKTFLEGRMFNGSIVCAVVLHYLEQVPGYFPTETSKRQAAKEAMSRIMLHLYVTFSHTIPILCSSYDFNSKKFRCNLQTNYGWFSMCSKLKHSCEPNLMLVGLNDSVALVAQRTIKKGEELTISYIEHFYDATIVHPFGCHSHLRASRIFLAIQYMCDCRVCTEDWDSTCDDLKQDMTARQIALFKKLQSLCSDSESYKACCALAYLILDEFPLKSICHKSAYEAIRFVLNLVQCKVTNNKTYIL